MAWIDDRIWCHPKFSDLSAPAFAAYVRGIAYSSGFGTKGVLTPGQQKSIRSDQKTRGELIRAGLWDTHENGVVIHDWDEHNSKRDARREADRERKKAYRAQKRPQDAPQDAPQDGTRTSAGQSAGASTGTARVDGSEGSDERRKTEGSTVSDTPKPQTQTPSYDARANGDADVVLDLDEDGNIIWPPILASAATGPGQGGGSSQKGKP